MNPATRKKLNNILKDNMSGSTEILNKLIKLCIQTKNDSKSLKEIISEAEAEFKSFSVVLIFIYKFIPILNEGNKKKISKYLEGYFDQIDKKYINLFNNSLRYLKDCKKIVTLSNSRTVLEILTRLNKRNKIYVFIGESRPKFEGRILAKELLKNKVKVEIVPDTYLPNAVEKSDAAVIGADAVLSNGDVVNKTGSRTLALACKYFKKPFYVLATKEKFSEKKKYTQEERDESEIWNYDHPLLKRTNYYFEIVEKKLITRVILD